MNKTILATLITTVFSSYVLAQKVDVELANLATEKTIQSQMDDIDAATQVELNAQSEEAVELNGVAYEQDDSGVWKAIGGGALGLTAALLSGSSSGGKSSPSIDDDFPIADNDTPGLPGVDNDIPRYIELDRLTIITDASGVVVDGERYYATPEGLKAADGKILATFDTLNQEIIGTNGEAIGTWSKVGIGYHVELTNGMKVITDGAGNSIILDTNADKIVDGLRVDSINRNGNDATVVTNVSDDYTHSAVNAYIKDDNGDLQHKSGIVIVDRNTGDIHAGKVGNGITIVGNINGINNIKPTNLQTIKNKIKNRLAK